MSRYELVPNSAVLSHAAYFSPPLFRRQTFVSVNVAMETVVNEIQMLLLLSDHARIARR